MRSERSIGPLALLLLGINGVVGVGIFFAPSELALAAGRRGSVLVLLAVAIGLVPVAATFAILGRRFDVDGGPVTFARAAFGEPVGFIVGWLSYASALFSTSAVLSGLATAIASERTAGPLSIGLALGLSAVVALGIHVSKRAWSAVTVLKLVPLVALALLALVKAPRSLMPEVAAPTATDLGRAALSACFAFQGFEIVPVVSGQAHAPGRAVPLAVFGSLVFPAALYAVLQWSFVATVPDLHEGAPLVQVASNLGGTGFGDLLRLGTSVSALGIAFGMVVTTPRYLAAAVNAGRFARMSPRGVPLAALGVTSAALVVLLALASLGQLFALASLAVVVQYGVVACALARLAFERKVGLARAHIVPATLTLVTVALLLSAPTREEWLVFAVAAGSGALLYWWRIHAPASRN